MESVKRASIGQSFGTGDETAVSLKVLVSNKLVGGVIGKAGATINTIKETSGAKVKVGQLLRRSHSFGLIFYKQVSNNTELFPGTTDRIILLSGSLNSVMLAARMVVAELFKETPKESVEPTFVEVSFVSKSVKLFIEIMSCSFKLLLLLRFLLLPVVL